MFVSMVIITGGKQRCDINAIDTLHSAVATLEGLSGVLQWSLR